MDYRMSEKFGLNWKEYDHKRVREFMEIMRLDAEREKKDAERNNKKYGRH